MEMVAAGHDEAVELSAGGVAELRRVHVLKEDELGDRFVGYVKQRTGDALGVVIDSIDGEVVVARTLTANGGTGPGAETTGASGTGGQQRKIKNTKTDRRGRQVLNLLHRKGGRYLGGGCVDRHVRLTGDLDSSRPLSNCQADVMGLNCGGLHVKTFDGIGREPRNDGAEIIRSLGQVRDAVFPCCIRLAGIDDSGGIVCGFHR